MAAITLKGRRIPLLYTTWEMKEIQEEIGRNDRIMTIITGRNPDDKADTSGFGAPEHLEAIAKLIRILGNAGLEENGEPADLTEKKILRALRPNELAMAVNACITAINEGLSSEIPKEEEEGPVDVTLEEMKKKGTKDA